MPLNRRGFLQLSAATGAAISARSLLAAESSSASSALPRHVGPNDKLNVLSIGVIGHIGGDDRKEVASHPMARIAGLCDVDANSLTRAGQDHPDAFRVKDYREAFAKYGSKFDAVIVATPDHTHCAIDTMALAAGKHVYGQKPLVHQLEELTIVRRMVEAHPDLSTQLGNQRMSIPGRRAAVFILKTGMLGKAKEAYVVTNSGLNRRGGYFNNRVLYPVEPPPANLDWDLWQSGAQPLMDYRPNVAPQKWRSWWNYGSGGLGDWGCHLLDILFYAYGELDSPASVRAEVKDKVTEYFHARTCKSVLTYKVSSDQFAGDTFRVHYADEGQQPDRAALGLPPGPWPKETNLTCVVCEEGTLVLAVTGELQIWRGGRKEDGMKMPGLPVFEPFNHRHAWVDTALGRKSEHWTPFPVGLKITEGTILAVKATRFPDEELHWDRGNLAFINHAEATRTIVKRDYRKGFEPVRA